MDTKCILRPPVTPRDEFRVTPITGLETLWRHSGWAVRRRQTFECLCRIGATPARMDRFCNCGSGCTVEVNDATGEMRLAANYCRDRMCIPCGRARSARVTHALIAEAGQQTVRFATFTLRHSMTPLRDQITRLYKSFVELRRRKWFKLHCDGGAAILEVKIGSDGLWHVHLHTLLLGRFLPQKELSAEWHAVTGDSFVVDVRKVDHGRDAIRYCASYVGKPVDASIYSSTDRLDEAAAALRGRRIVNTWGKWAKLDLDAEDEAVGNWVSLGLLRSLVEAAALLNPDAIRILRSLSPNERTVRKSDDSS